MARNSTSFLAPYDDHTKPHYGTTLPQLTILVLWLGSIFVWIVRQALSKPTPDAVVDEPLARSSTSAATHAVVVVVDEGVANGSVPNGTTSEPDVRPKPGEHGRAPHEAAAAPSSSSRGNGSASTTGSGGPTIAKQNFSAVIPPPPVDEFLKQMILLGAIMFYFYLCDYRKIFEMGERVYSRDTFLFMVFLLFLVGCACTIRPTKDGILNRDHTEEWKGWMQVMFVWYHYFAAKEWYNWIRIYIACYVWMTGFGNFSFFWVRKDFSAWRFVKMLFRLDFLVLVICAAVSNEFMVYYICAMHTYWFFSVYLVMGVFSSWNQNRYRMAAKLAVYAACNAVVFDVPSVASTVFRPLAPILGMNDNPRDDLHEWTFRVGLDHWVCFVGMLCAYNHPHWERFMRYLESDAFNVRPGRVRRLLLGVAGPGDVVKIGVVGAVLALFGAWYRFVLPLEKFAYNRVHPYTSWMPIVAYIVGRNMWPAMRTRYVHLFAWLGKVTLETYLSQLHVYLQSNAKHLIAYIPGYPLLNFALSTLIYMFISFRLFHLTTTFSAYLLPQDRRTMVRNTAGAVGVVGAAVVVAWLLKLAGTA